MDPIMFVISNEVRDLLSLISRTKLRSTVVPRLANPLRPDT